MTILKQHTGLAVIEGELWIERQAGRQTYRREIFVKYSFGHRLTGVPILR